MHPGCVFAMVSLRQPTTCPLIRVVRAAFEEALQTDSLAECETRRPSEKLHR